jgi:hypothetical protein
MTFVKGQKVSRVFVISFSSLHFLFQRRESVNGLSIFLFSVSQWDIQVVGLVVGFYTRRIPSPEGRFSSGELPTTIIIPLPLYDFLTDSLFSLSIPFRVKVKL